MKNVKSDTIARTFVLALALINQVLAIVGKDALPFTEDSVYQICTLIATLITSGISIIISTIALINASYSS